MAIPFLNSITLGKNQVQDFCVFNYAGDPTPLTSAGDYGYFWLNTTGAMTLKWWDGANIRSLVDSTNISSFTSGLATDLAGGGAGQVVYQNGSNDTQFLAAGTAGQVLASNGSSAPSWLHQSSLSVGSATTATTANAVANALTAGTYLTSGGTYDGSVARTFAVDATDANTASKVVARDASGNFAAGTITAATVTGLSAPTLGSDATNKDYVDGVVQGLDIKASCLVATTTDITLSAPGAVTIDGVYSATDFTTGVTRILVKDQSAPAENGIYIWQGPAAAMTRSADANTWDELVAAFTFVERGTANADSGWVCNVNAGGTLGTTAVTWTKFSQAGSYTAGNGMVLSGGAFSFAQSSAYTAGRIPFASSTSAIGFSANLFWDNTNNRLGIGTASPNYNLHSVIASGFSGAFRSSTAAVGGILCGNTVGDLIVAVDASGNGRLTADTSKYLGLGSNGINDRVVLDSNGHLLLGTTVNPAYGRTTFVCHGTTGGIVRVSGPNAVGLFATSNTDNSLIAGTTTNHPFYFITNDTTKLTLDSSGYLYTAANGRIGVGVVPTAALDVDGQSNLRGTATISGGASNARRLGFDASGVYYNWIESDGTVGAGYMRFAVGNNEKMRIDSSGNLGLGVTPSAWGSYWKVAQVSRQILAVTGGDAFLGNNWYNDGSAYKYISAGWASYYDQTDGKHIWGASLNSGAIDGTISWNTQMTLDASGNLALGTATASFRADIQNSAGPAILRLKGGSGSTQGSAVYITKAGSAATLFAVGDRATILGGTVDQLSCLYSEVPITFEVNAAERLRIKSGGQLNFAGLAADPAGAAAGDVYYNSTAGAFKYYDTAWQTFPRKYFTALAGSNTTFDVDHNLNSREVTVTVRKTASPYDQVFTDVKMTTENKVQVVFASTVSGADYTVTVIG